MAQTLELFHGSPPGNILSIMGEGCMRPDVMHHIFFSARFEDVLRQGTDITLRASFAFKAQVTILDGAALKRTSTPGIPQTVLVTTVLPLPTKVLELYVRLGTVGKFELKHVEGAEAIKGYLLRSASAIKS